MATTDFQIWLDNLDDDDIETIHFLYESISGETEMGGFKTTKKNDTLVIKSDHNDQTLILASEKAKKTFLDKLNKEYGGEFGWVGGHYEFVRSMNKDD